MQVGRRPGRPWQVANRRCEGITASATKACKTCCQDGMTTEPGKATVEPDGRNTRARSRL
eukprot:14175007-Heterocapsa_arctica.AAC.1